MGHGNKVEFLVAICALVTSMVAVFIGWDQGRVMRAQQHGSVYPVLQVDGYVSTHGGATRMGLRFSNNGVGPALIESIDVLREGQRIDDLSPYLESLPPGYELSWHNMLGRAIAPGEDIIALEFGWSLNDLPHDRVLASSKAWESLSFETCYCSVFNRCWKMADIGTSRAERVDRCRPGDTDIFSDIAASAEPGQTPAPEVD